MRVNDTDTGTNAKNTLIVCPVIWIPVRFLELYPGIFVPDRNNPQSLNEIL